MTTSPATAARLARLSRELTGDAQALDARAHEIRALLNVWGTDAGSSRHAIIVAAVNIHGWYTALEAAFERTARLLDQTVPTGPSWHTDLVSQMAVAVPGLRPLLVDPGLEVPLAEVRKFRHFFRNAYVLEFDTPRIREQADRVVDLHAPVREGLDQLIKHLSDVLEDLASR